eukprot:TRINITY_DN460_c0_g1_i2.p1 TRINITY_DN460_c0_g1~~TRINITY_DN460_c0_g1_i2.p1  ORF type:complete len:308 (-),score=84.95 TRINITY_DN460_c0_g1_i2:43-966(-)
MSLHTVPLVLYSCADCEAFTSSFFFYHYRGSPDFCECFFWVFFFFFKRKVSTQRIFFFFFFFQAEDGIRDVERSRGLGDVYKRQYQRRVHGGTATPEVLKEAKSVVGEEDVNLLVKQFEEMPEDEKKSAMEYMKMYQAMTANFESAMKDQGIDLSDPNLNPDLFVKGMSSMFSKVMAENKDNPQFNEAINAMGENLYNKEILYPPLKKLCDLYPKWLEENKGKVSATDYERYESQFKLLQTICESFDKSERDVVGFINMINKLTEYGTPPPELASQVKMPDLFGSMVPPAEMAKPHEGVDQHQSLLQ